MILDCVGGMGGVVPDADCIAWVAIAAVTLAMRPGGRDAESCIDKAIRVISTPDCEAYTDAESFCLPDIAGLAPTELILLRNTPLSVAYLEIEQ